MTWSRQSAAGVIGLGAHAIAASDVLLASPTLIGRERPLVELCDRARDGGIAVVEGEAGVGKTRLVAEVRSRLERESRRMLVGHCQPYRDPLPLLPVVEALREVGPLLRSLRLSPLAGALRPLLPEFADRLPGLPEALGDAAAERYRVFRALREVLTALGSVVLTVEDAHWADDVTVELLQLLAANRPTGLSLLVTYRAEDLAPQSPLRTLGARTEAAAVTRVALAPLGPDGCRALVRAILGTEAVSAEFATFLYERTEGLPFAVEEVLRLLVDRADLVRTGALWGRHPLGDIAVPDAIRDAIAQRVDRLSPAARDLLVAIAVVGEPASDDLLSRMGVLGDGVTALCELTDSGLVEDDGAGHLRFRHVLAREAVYHALPSPRRRQLHRLAADALVATGRTAPGPLARHFQAAGSVVEWAAYAEQGADEAARLHDERTACRILADVLTAAPLGSGARVRLALKLGRWAPDGVAGEVAADVLGLALEQGVTDPAVRGELRYLRGRALTYVHDAPERWAEGYAEIRAAVPDLDARPELAAAALCYLSLPDRREGHLDELRRCAEQALLHLDAVSPLRRFAVRNDHVMLLVASGDPDARSALRALPRNTAGVAERREEARGLANVGYGALVVGHDRLAADVWQRAGTIATEIALDRLAVELSGLGSWLDWFGGRWDRLFDDATSLPFLRTLRSHACVVARSPATLVDSVRGMHRAKMTDSMLAAAALTPVLLAEPVSPQSAELAEETLAIVRAKGMWAWGGAATQLGVLAAVEAGRLEWAEALTADLDAGAAGLEAPATGAALAWCRGVVAAERGDRETAIDRLAAARVAWQAMPRPYDAALAGERLGAVLLDVDPDRTHAVLLDALRELHALGAARPAARIRRTLRRRGVPLPAPWRSGPKARGSALTPRETEVAQLAGEGWTNRRIAEALALSPRTVEHHVERAMRKLGVRSRAALGVERLA